MGRGGGVHVTFPEPSPRPGAVSVGRPLPTGGGRPPPIELCLSIAGPMRRIDAPAAIVKVVMEDLCEAKAERLAQSLSRATGVHNVSYAGDTGYGGSFTSPWLEGGASGARHPRSRSGCRQT